MLGSRKQPIIFVTAAIFLIMLISVLVVFFVAVGTCESENENINSSATHRMVSQKEWVTISPLLYKLENFEFPTSRVVIAHNTSVSDPDSLQFVTRDEWIAQPPMHELANLELPAFRVIIAHTATEGCYTQAQCTFRVRFIQTFHIESRNFDDIGYNFLVGGDGAVYEGRGWNKQGAHTKGYNKGSICVAFIGTFISIEPPAKQLRAAKLIIEEGVRLGKLKPDYKLYGHRQLIPSESPGEALYKILQTWSHWTNEV